MGLDVVAANLRAERAEAELARYSKLPPLADGEEYASVGWWRSLDPDERERWEWRYTWDDQWWDSGVEPSPADDDRDHIVVRERPAPEPPAVEVGQWRKAPDGRVGKITVKGATTGFDAGYGQTWHCESTVKSWPLCEPPTVAIKARDLRAGMVEAETGRVAMPMYPKCDHTIGNDGTLLAVRPWWDGRAQDGWVSPDALYTIRVDSLPDGWQPSGEGDR